MAHVQALLREGRARSGRLIVGARAWTPELVLLLALVLWWFVPFVVLLPGDHGTFNGSNGLQVDDHMQYLAFIRDAGENILISNRFDVVSDPRLFLHPLFLVSGLAWQLGLSLQVAFLLWQPVSVAVLFLGFAAYVRRMFGDDRAARTVALVIALFFFSPAAPLAEWLGDDEGFQFATLVVALEMSPENYIWGGFPGAIAVGAMPLYLLAAERLLEPSRRTGRSAGFYALAAGAAGATASWLHPWQGITLLVMTAGLVAWGRFDRRYLPLSVPVALTTAPLAYFFVLSKTDSSWAFVTQPNQFDHVGWWFAAGFAPAILALPGFPGRDLDLQQRLVRLWPAAALLVYFALQRGWFYHAIAGLSLPLAVLAVSWLRRLRPPGTAVLAACVVLTVPGLVFVVQELREAKEDHFFAPGERAGLAWLDAFPRDGPVLAPQRLGIAVPGFAGRQTWVGHYTWTRDYGRRVDRAEALFEGRLPVAEARGLVRESRAAFLLSDCAKGRVDLREALRPLLLRMRRFGCATVYEVAGPQ